MNPLGDLEVHRTPGAHQHAYAPGRTACRQNRLVRGIRADLRLYAGDRVANTRSILEILLLQAGPGTTLVIEATGEDAPEALESAGRLLAHARLDDPTTAPETNARAAATAEAVAMSA